MTDSTAQSKSGSKEFRRVMSTSALYRVWQFCFHSDKKTVLFLGVRDRFMTEYFATKSKDSGLKNSRYEPMIVNLELPKSA